MSVVLGYVATCKVNGKCYVGITSGSLENRIRKHVNASSRGSGYYFHAAIRRYGVGAFDWEVQETFGSWGSACKWERVTIEALQTFDSSKGYNLTKGGEGSYGLSPSEVTRAKISATLKAWYASGDPRALEVRRKVSQFRRTVVTRPETRLKQAEAGRKRRLSEASRQKLSLSKRKYPTDLVETVVAYAKSKGLRAAERQYSIPRPTIRRWVRSSNAFPLVSSSEAEPDPDQMHIPKIR